MSPQDAFDRYHRQIYSFVRRMTRSAQTAEDITQDCFVAFVRSPQRFDGAKGTVRTYLFSIARNLTLKHFRDSAGEEQRERHGME